MAGNSTPGTRKRDLGEGVIAMWEVSNGNSLKDFC